MTINENSEESRLLESKVLFGEIKLKYSKWVAYTIVMLIVFTQCYSVVSSIYIMNQYAYFAFMNEKYPTRNTMQTIGGSDSACTVNTSKVEYKQQIVVQKLTSEWNIYCALAQNIPAVFISMNLASYSDVYGRKPFFIVPLIGTFLKNLACSLGIYFKIGIQWFIGFYVIEGSTGIWASTLSMAFCFVADTTMPGKTRSFVIALIETSIGLGSIISTSLSGYIIQWTNSYMYPEFLSVIIVTIGILLAVFVLPETLHPSRKRDDHVSICQNMRNVTECYTSEFSPLGKRWMFILLIFIFIMSAFGNLGRSNVEQIYQMNSPFCWDSVRIGWYAAVRNLAWSFGSIAIIKVFHLCTTDDVIALVGCITCVASAILEGIASTDLYLYLAAAASIGSVVTLPMIRAIMSQMTPPHKQGSIFAGVAAVEVICNMGASVSANAIYDATIDYYKGMTFFVMAGYGAVGLILCLLFISEKKRTLSDITPK
ncbi:lysosomal proton-coupled steroid conjugate and bile acid symporter SLC46A3-like [Mytilus trossulus]|uniref:lysosomal proton-coupled steroid conjugate and bile acid symporter SLC46A3-like n=1 Tax=Mytilus trossulus TaxID=6551 RepID=UPI00300449AF